jgi:hypothetical protein
MGIQYMRISLLLLDIGTVYVTADISIMNLLCFLIVCAILTVVGL